MFDVLKNAVIVDTETTSLNRGAGIHELAIYDLEQQKVFEYIFNPNLSRAVSVDRLQDTNRLASSGGDQFEWITGLSSWRAAIQSQTEHENKTSYENWPQVKAALKDTNEFLYDALDSNVYPHLLDKPTLLNDFQRGKQISQLTGGVELVTRGSRDLDKFLMSEEFMNKLSGKTIWVANPNFESKILGAHINALANTGADVNALTAFKSSMETYSSTTMDPMYVTGVEVNKARTKAQSTGDWTQVWDAYRKHTSKAGETAVRDIQDVTRAFLSYGKKLGLVDGVGDNYGNAIDLTYRLFGSIDPDKKKAKKMLLFKEVHRAAEDAAISERYVLEKGIHYTEALRHVSEGTEYGQQLLRDASTGKGALHEASQYFARLKKLAPEIEQENMMKRLARSALDIMDQGYSTQISDVSGVRVATQQSPRGPVDIPLTTYKREVFRDVKSVARHLSEQDLYVNSRVNINDAAESLNHALAGKHDKAALATWLAENTTREHGGERYSLVNAAIKENADSLLSTNNPLLDSTRRRFFASNYKDKVLNSLKSAGNGKSKIVAGLVAGLASTVVAGVAFSPFSERETKKESMVFADYQRWKTRQDGMSEQGIAGSERKHNTDFGSPYQGPWASQRVLVNQELLAEREKLLREKYGAQHYDEFQGVFGIYGAFKNFGAFKGGYSYLKEGHNVYYSGDKGLRGNLKTLNLTEGNWDVHADDADTITIKRGGLRGKLASFFGFNKGYSFRMAGIDSTETSHGEHSYHAPQPHAQDSAAAFAQMLKGSKNLELVYDPTNTTYGRMMGAVIADGQNLNFELVKQGLAAHLPYGKQKDSMIDYDALQKLEEQSYLSRRGLWGHEWARSFYDFSEASGNRVTFNSLASKSRLAENMGLMSQLSMMEQAEASGFYGNAEATAAAQAGTHYNFKGDHLAPKMFSWSNAPAKNYYDQMLADTSHFMTTKGTGYHSNKASPRSGYGKLNSYLALDTMDANTSIWNKRNANAFEAYGSDYARKRESRQRQAEAQRNINRQFGMSQVNHHRM